MDRAERPRRLRRDGLRELVRETRLHASDLVAPVFVDATADEPQPIDAMPGQVRLPVDDVVPHVRDLTSAGIEAVILFGVPDSKDEAGSRAWADDGVVQRATRRLTDATDVTVMCDTCLCEYTSHGHCGALEPDAREDPTLTVDNDATLDRLADIAVSQAEAGAACVAPSAAMDGQVGAIRGALDEAGFADVAILSYAVKTHSAFYGPFREAADGAPAFGDRRHYQGDPANAREARREVRLDVDEGADICMVKPALPNLDLVRDVRATIDRPVAAYNVSGEYAMLHAAADRGWLDLDATARESLLGIKRAGADLIVTYFAERLAPDLPD
jgi:porphobilinogen synthase